MDYIRDRESNIPFSLHDSRILQIEINETTLTLKLDRIFHYAGDEEKWYQGIIEFIKADIEECDIMLFNRPYGYDGEKSFTGESISLAEFNAKYPDAVFEIVTEGYSGYDTIFQSVKNCGDIGACHLNSNTAGFFLRAKQMGLTLSELDEGTVMDMLIESGNDLCDDDYRQVATQEDFDSF